ncbi:MAG: hypothetical protein IJA31_00320 [Clostridia bacterium]|nr:hypothetical protein [Clostridia bacterium]
MFSTLSGAKLAFSHSGAIFVSEVFVVEFVMSTGLLTVDLSIAFLLLYTIFLLFSTFSITGIIQHLQLGCLKLRLRQTSEYKLQPSSKVIVVVGCILIFFSLLNLLKYKKNERTHHWLKSKNDVCAYDY